VNRQLELDLGGHESRARRLLRALVPSSGLYVRLAGGTLAWAPVWLPALLFAQIALGGLRLALAEEQRLDVAETAVAGREDRLAAESATLARQRRMLDDPVYRGLPEPGLPEPGLPEPGLPEPGLPEPGLPEPGLPGPGTESGTPGRRGV
jgi:hypothetical protein